MSIYPVKRGVFCMRMQKYPGFYGFWAILAPFWGPFWGPKSVNVGIDFMLNFILFFMSHLGRFGDDFGAILVAKEGPKLEIVKYEK